MVKTLYVCRECGFVFPSELKQLIENKVQVFCEMCGMPFTLAGVEFKQPSVSRQMPPIKSYSREAVKERSRQKFSKAIQKLDSFTYIPILILSCVLLTTSWMFIDPANWINSLIIYVLTSVAGLSIAYIDIKQITPKIKEEKYDDILLNAFVYGILGCFFYGTGVLILIKGILIFIYVLRYNKDKDHKVYRFGLKLKNSLNSLSASAGFIILLMILVNLYGLKAIANIISILDGIDLIMVLIGPMNEILNIIIIIAIIIGISLIPLVILLIDHRKRKDIQQKSEFTTSDAVKVFILGVFGIAIYSMGIFILLKSILLFLLVAGKPFNWGKELPVVVIEEKQEAELKEDHPKQEELPEEKELPPIETEKLGDPQEIFEKAEVKEEIIEEITEDTSKVAPPIPAIIPLKDEKKQGEKKQDNNQLRLHESLLPVSDDKDKLMVRQYFTKIFTVLSDDTRRILLELEIPEEDKIALLKELAYLAEEEQSKYIASIKQLYKEIPLKLIERIKNLPNVKPEHYDKIIAQLNFLNDDEQFEFIKFLEQNA